MTTARSDSFLKMRKLVELTRAIERQRAALIADPSTTKALELQNLLEQRQNLQATMRPVLVR